MKANDNITEKALPLWLFLIAFIPLTVSAQFSVANRLEYQLGNLPDVEPESRTSLYDQLNLSYTHQNLTAGVRAEFFKTEPTGRQYSKFQQKYIYYQGEQIEIRLGNFYETLGRGLLLRSYEIPGVVYEDLGSRQRYGFYKDVEGVSLRYFNQFIQAKILYGRPLDLLSPPKFSSRVRRPNLVQGGEVNVQVLPAFSPGILFLRQDMQSRINEYGGLNLSGYFDSGTRYYVEYIQEKGNGNKFLRFGKTNRHAFYASVSQVFSGVSFSLELKDYNAFTLNFNDPPSLIREHAPTLLNRTTHTVDTQNERGFQLESIVNLGSLNTATFNVSAAENQTFTDDKQFYEFFADLNLYFSERTQFKPFIDFSQDEVISAKNRFTSGFSIEQQLFNLWSGYFNLELQQFDRTYSGAPELDHRATNALSGFSLSRAPDLTFGMTVEVSNDPLETNTLLNFDAYHYATWPGFFVNYQVNQDHMVQVFYGKRRGGNACSGGICYEVLPFKGLEVRVNSIL